MGATQDKKKAVLKENERGDLSGRLAARTSGIGDATRSFASRGFYRLTGRRSSIFVCGSLLGLIFAAAIYEQRTAIEYIDTEPD